MARSIESEKRKRAYTAEYRKQHYRRVGLDLAPTKYDEIKAAADSLGESVNGYIKKAIDIRLASDRESN